MPRPGTTLFLVTGFAAGLVASHYYRVHSVSNLPPNFRAYITSDSNSRWGLYHRHLDRPIALPSGSTSGLPSESVSSAHPPLQRLINAILTSKPYKLEIAMSGAPQPPENFALVERNKIGNLTLESIPSETEAIFHYEYPGIDFRMYLATPSQKDILIGFVDYSGSITQELGSRVYSRMLTESAARTLERLS